MCVYVCLWHTDCICDDFSGDDVEVFRYHRQLQFQVTLILHLCVCVCVFVCVCLCVCVCVCVCINMYIWTAPDPNTIFQACATNSIEHACPVPPVPEHFPSHLRACSLYMSLMSLYKRTYNIPRSHQPFESHKPRRPAAYSKVSKVSKVS